MFPFKILFYRVLLHSFYITWFTLISSPFYNTLEFQIYVIKAKMYIVLRNSLDIDVIEGMPPTKST